MPNTNLGKVSITPKGAYDTLAEYNRLDAVTWKGSSYLALKSLQGVEPADGEDWMLLADGALVDVVSVAGAEVALTLANNTEYRCTDAVTRLTIDGFAPGDPGKAEQWGLVFTASADGITVTLPDTVIWAVAEPVFTAGSTYWLSVVPLGGKYLAAWTEIEAEVMGDESESA